MDSLSTNAVIRIEADDHLRNGYNMETISIPRAIARSARFDQIATETVKRAAGNIEHLF